MLNCHVYHWIDNQDYSYSRVSFSTILALFTLLHFPFTPAGFDNLGGVRGFSGVFGRSLKGVLVPNSISESKESSEFKSSCPAFGSCSNLTARMSSSSSERP